MVFKIEYLDARHPSKIRELNFKKEVIEKEIQDLAERFEIDKSLWYLWEKKGQVLTSVGAMIPIDAFFEKSQVDEEELAQSVHVLGRGAGQSHPIVGLNYSLMSFLANSALYALRLYVLLPPDKEDLAEEIQSYIEQLWASLH